MEDIIKYKSTLKIDSKCRLTIPIFIREELNLNPKDKLVIALVQNKNGTKIIIEKEKKNND